MGPSALPLLRLQNFTHRTWPRSQSMGLKTVRMKSILRHRFSPLNSFPSEDGKLENSRIIHSSAGSWIVKYSTIHREQAWLLCVVDATELHMPSEETVIAVLSSFFPTLKYSSSLFFCKLFHIPGPLLSLIYINLFYQAPLPVETPATLGVF